MSDPTRHRLDVVLVARRLVATRARARDVILRGEVLVGGAPATRPARLIGPDEPVALVAGAADYVSRGALKLRAALTHFGLVAEGRVAIDVGASTGGFTEVLLAAGARRVYAVENGSRQLHPKLANDPRVVSLEGTDARRLDRILVPEPIGAIVADVSFISLTKALPASLALAAPGSWLVALVKPQFEGEPGGVPRDGIVKDEAARQQALAKLEAWIGAEPGWRPLGAIPSPIHGGDGNQEFLLAAVRDA
jgi:23S rRNA (cytidine1920-2'-O)/16S rRNA (cytidine1409-2'-O)-methyltransferase